MAVFVAFVVMLLLGVWFGWSWRRSDQEVVELERALLDMFSRVAPEREDSAQSH